MTHQDKAQQRERLAALAVELTAQRGQEISADMLAAEAGLSRSRIEAIFPEDGDLFDAMAEIWFAPLIEIMEEVIATDLPANRKFYEFFGRRFIHLRQEYNRDPEAFALLCELGGRRFERVRSFVDLADHYTCELIAQAQDEGAFEGLEIDRALTLVNQMVIAYTNPDIILMVGDRLSEDKLAKIIDTMFAGLNADDGGSRGVSGLRAA